MPVKPSSSFNTPSFYKSNYVQRFHYSRPVRKGPVDPNNEFVVSYGFCRQWNCYTVAVLWRFYKLVGYTTVRLKTGMQWSPWGKCQCQIWPIIHSTTRGRGSARNPASIFQWNLHTALESLFILATAEFTWKIISLNLKLNGLYNLDFTHCAAYQNKPICFKNIHHVNVINHNVTHHLTLAFSSLSNMLSLKQAVKLMFLDWFIPSL